MAQARSRRELIDRSLDLSKQGEVLIEELESFRYVDYMWSKTLGFIGVVNSLEPFNPCLGDFKLNQSSCLLTIKHTMYVHAFQTGN